MLLECFCSLLAIRALAHLVYQRLTQPIAHIDTGEKRRALCPPGDQTTANGNCTADFTGLRQVREVRSLKSGKRAFAQVVAPAEASARCILVFLHGYSSQSDMYLEDAAILARRGVVVLLPDLPCHGRTDGLLTYVPDWWTWVAEVWEIIELFLPMAVEAAHGQTTKVFLGGISLGGGLSACLCIQRPTFFQGVILLAPMLFVADDVKPNIVVQKIFKWFLVPLLPKWPITPVEDLDDYDYRVPIQGHQVTAANALSMKGLKARLGTAMQFGMVFPDWVETHMARFRTPVLIMHGESDKITDIEMSKRLYKEASSSDKTLKTYEGAFHGELISCLPSFAHIVGSWLPDQTATTDQCLSDMAEWLEARV